jgi:hypothetical protein
VARASRRFIAGFLPNLRHMRRASEDVDLARRINRYTE